MTSKAMMQLQIDQLHEICAQRQTEIERLKSVIMEYLEGNYERPLGDVYRDDGAPSKFDKCTHNMWMYEECPNCADNHFESALGI